MKTIYFLKTLVIFLFVLTASAQQGINYKAMIKDANGDALANTTVTVQFNILENGTTDVFKESHNPTTDDSGIIIVNIGEGTLISGDFNSINWGSNAHFLNTKIDSGNGLTDMGTTEFKTVPYALYAKNGSGASEINDLIDAKTNGSSVFVGHNSGINDDGIYNKNAAIGYRALEYNTSGHSNTAIGNRSLNYNRIGFENTAVGTSAGIASRGNGNVFIGHHAGYYFTGSNELFIANSLGRPLIGGNFSTKEVIINGDLDVIEEVTINGDLEVAEKITAPDSGNADMKAYIYGMVTKAGNKISSASSDGFTVSRSTKGIYQILFTGTNKPVGTNSYIVLATAEMMVAGDYNFPAAMKITNGFWIFIKNVEKDFHTDSQFSFVVYQK